MAALLSVPMLIQHLAFNQPNVAVLRFSFIWLPTFAVPVVAFTHIVAPRRLL